MGLEPTMTTFLQALNISSKITKGNIEILNDEHLLHKGEKGDASSAALLQKLGMVPFSYGLVTKFIYQNGAIFEPAVLDITDAQIIATFQAGIKNIACVSLMLNQPTVVSVPYSILLAFSNLLAVAAATEFTFTEAEEIKKYLADPSAFACAAPAATTAAAPTAGAPAAADDAAPAASIFGGKTMITKVDGGPNYPMRIKLG